MKIGDTIESAAWTTGDEPPETRAQYEEDVRFAITRLCDLNGFLHGPVTFTEFKPGDERVPEVPKHVQGSNVRLLIGEADVIARKPESKPHSFIANLDRKDLIRLRALTRKAALKMTRRIISDVECDAIIEACGPDAAIETLRRKDTLQ